MRIVSIEPTPSPNTMKVSLDEELPMGKSSNYKKDTVERAPDIIKAILHIEGVKGVYHVADFLAVERNARFDWQEILRQVRRIFGQEQGEANKLDHRSKENFGEIKVQVQMYKGIPMQVKLSDGDEERRFGLPDEFLNAVTAIRSPDDNVVVERRWKDQGVRYGDLNEVGNSIIDELVAAYPSERLESIVNEKERQDKKTGRLRGKVTMEDFRNPDWKVRYQLLEGMDAPTIGDLPLLEQALHDEKASIRRLATVYLGMIEDKAVLPALYKALQDKTVTVRRTAGDCLSDLGYPEAVPAMMDALKDDSKLVRWRAAMFLYEVADERALPALKEAESDPEFEVSMQAKIASERILHGEEAKGSVWKQMTESRKNNN
ncbi:conserved virulence factor C family protein [Bacillus massilinigeriensis]|uniref:conserved virulence factor C family protein n=1 Tax=Bacillus mediterraneensis TaxID=1805474 RepID=UPI0008F8E4B4|nr:conserved virulence factor C family protein [Bacillus mediterraneensis]